MNTVAGAPIFGWMTALADATRARLLRLVEKHELSVAELCAVLQVPQSTASRHLKVLVDDGWLTVRSEGTSRFYRLANGQLDPAARRLWTLLREHTAQGGVTEHDDRRLAGVLAGRRTRSQAFFGSIAGRWDRLRSELFGDQFHLLALAGLLDDQWAVADLGCGTGQIAETLAPFVRQVIAVESSRNMLAAARQRLAGLANVELRRGELERLPIDDAALDAAVICLVLHHVAEPAAVLREAARALRPGGRLLIIDMAQHERAEYRQQMGHVWLGFTPAQLGEWLAAAGFAAVRVHSLPPPAAAKGPALFAAAATKGGD